MYELQGPKLAIRFGSPPDSVAAELGAMSPKPSTKAVVELKEQGHVESNRL